jgi:hypothetical protein
MEAGIFRSGKRMVIPAPANACAAIKSRPAPHQFRTGVRECVARKPQPQTVFKAL